jgi:hypothetical protein
VTSTAARTVERAAGVLMIVVGGVGLFVGAVAVLLSSSDSYFTRESDAGVTAGVVGAVLGVALVGSGVAVLVSGSREPTVDIVPRRDGDDVAPPRSRDASRGLPAASTPLGYGFTF